MNFQTFKESVQNWADSKNINNPDTQILKYLEEKGEFAKAVRIGDRKEIQDELGDLFVVGVIYFWQKKSQAFTSIGYDVYLDEKRVSFYLMNLDRFIYLTDSTYFDILRNINEIYGFDLSETLQNVYNKISNRTGKTVDGCFIKD